MYTIFVAPKMRTEQSADAFRYQDVKSKQREQTEDRKRHLSMKWDVVSDEHGSRRLQMRWTGARSPVPPTFRSSTSQCVQPAMGRGSDPTPGPEARVAIY
jgi:hypothetical protein